MSAEPEASDLRRTVRRANALLDALNTNEAGALIARAEGDVTAASDDPDRLRLEMARARWLALTEQSAAAIALRQSLEPLLARRFGVAAEETLENQRLLAIRLLTVGRNAEALELLRQVISQARASADQHSEVGLRAETALATELSESGQHASHLLADILQRAEAAKATWSLIDNARFALAQALRSEGRADDAVAVARTSFDSRRAALGDDDQRTLRAAIEYGYSLGLTGDTDAGIEWMRELSARIEKQPDVFKPIVLSAREVLLELLIRAGRESEALAGYHAFVPQLLQVYRPEDPRVFAVVGAYMYVGFQLRDTAPCRYEGVMRANIEASADHRGEFLSYAQMAASYCDWLKGDHTGALAAAQSGWQRLRSLRPDDDDVLRFASVVASMQLESGDREAARQTLRSMQKDAERQRSTSVFSSRLRFARAVSTRESLPGYRTLVELDAEAGDATAAWYTAELSKGRQLLDADLLRVGQVNATLAVARELARARDQIDEAEVAHALAPDASARAAASERLAAGQRVLLQLGTALSAPAQRSSALALRGDDVFVHVVLSNDTLVLLTRRARQAPRIVAIKPLRGAAALVAAARRAIGAEPEPGRLWQLADGSYVDSVLRPPTDALRLRDESALLVLDDLLITPLATQVVAGAHLIVSPDGPLAELPWEILPSSASGRVQYSYAQSLAAYANAAAQRQRARQHLRLPLLALGVAQPQLSSTALDARLASLSWPPLGNVDAELDAIAAAYKTRPPRAQRQVSVLRGAAASEAALEQLNRSGELARFEVIHIAAHAWLAGDAPDLSALVLGAAPQATDRTAGYLTAAELKSYRFASDLVVLSACTSSGGVERAGEGLIGLVQALFVAGTSGAIVSLWPVSDQATAVLMGYLHRRLAAGVAPALALNQARAELAAAGYPSRDWAAFVYYGVR